MRLSLADRFLLLRRHMKLTQTELGKLIGCQRKVIWRVESGTGVPMRKTVELFKILEQRHRGRDKGRG
jgi:DNA-binding XRE family transcriptional regulator